MRRLFGDACIRTTRSHAKFATIRNDRWAIAVRTSMNLNENPRLENIEISDDPALCGFLESVADDLYADQPTGIFDGELPPAPPPAVAVGHVGKGLSTPTTGPRH
jgi:hypothetical protein